MGIFENYQAWAMIAGHKGGFLAWKRCEQGRVCIYRKTPGKAGCIR